MKRTRNPFRRLWIRWRLRRICKALEIDLWPEVKAYVLHGDTDILYGPRRNGKTTAVLLDILVNKRAALDYTLLGICDVFFADPDCLASDKRIFWYREHLCDAANRCLDAGIDVLRRDVP